MISSGSSSHRNRISSDTFDLHKVKLEMFVPLEKTGKVNWRFCVSEHKKNVLSLLICVQAFDIDIIAKSIAELLIICDIL